jgi:hypothetical protein
MHGDPRVRRRVDEPEERPREPAPSPPEHALLALQRSAGNRATGAALQRFWVSPVDRHPTPQAASRRPRRSMPVIANRDSYIPHGFRVPVAPPTL